MFGFFSLPLPEHRGQFRAATGIAFQHGCDGLGSLGCDRFGFLRATALRTQRATPIPIPAGASGLGSQQPGIGHSGSMHGSFSSTASVTSTSVVSAPAI